MARGVLASVFVFVLLQCAFSGNATAQTGSNCTGTTEGEWDCLWGANCYTPPPPGSYNCQGVPYEFEVICEIQNKNCSPAAGPGETAPGESCPHCAYPISLLSGNTYIEETDVRIPGLSGGLTLLRTWNSMWPATQSAFQVGIFGPNWKSNFEEQVFVGADNYVKYARGDGSFWSFGYAGASGTAPLYDAVAPANAPATLTAGSTYWTLTFKSGEQRLFDNTSGKLIGIVDRNGNTTQLTYDSLGRLITVTDPVSRHLYFNYGSGTYLATSVTSDFGESVSYAYDSQGRLIQVTEPDQSTLSFQYDSNSLISAVLDSDGKILEAHNYDSSGRGLTSSRANGVDAVTISYGNP
jgi:YD repeat-containing protein